MPKQSISGPLIVPPRTSLPVVLSIPHAGRSYPDWLIALSRRGLESLRALEDPLVDQLAGRALGLGLGAVVAQSPRALIDCNRSTSELDPAAIDLPPGPDPGHRARGGLGIIPGRTQRDGPLWHAPLSEAEFRRRLDQAHEPYHRAIDAMLREIRDRCGGAILVDCHSMPARSLNQPRIVVGDRNGGSAALWVAEGAAGFARRSGFSAVRNIPYAGGWIIERHGRPAANIHAIQLEIDRGCYLGRSGAEAGPGFEAASQWLEALVRHLAGEFDARQLAQAAE